MTRWNKNKILVMGGLGLVGLLFAVSGFAAEAVTVTETVSTTPWWVWALALFVVSFFLGIVAVLGGVGGGFFLFPSSGVFSFPFTLTSCGGRG